MARLEAEKFNELSQAEKIEILRTDPRDYDGELLHEGEGIKKIRQPENALREKYPRPKHDLMYAGEGFLGRNKEEEAQLAHVREQFNQIEVDKESLRGGGINGDGIVIVDDYTPVLGSEPNKAEEGGVFKRMLDRVKGWFRRG